MTRRRLKWRGPVPVQDITPPPPLYRLSDRRLYAANWGIDPYILAHRPLKWAIDGWRHEVQFWYVSARTSEGVREAYTLFVGELWGRRDLPPGWELIERIPLGLKEVQHPGYIENVHSPDDPERWNFLGEGEVQLIVRPVHGVGPDLTPTEANEGPEMIWVYEEDNWYRIPDPGFVLNRGYNAYTVPHASRALARLRLNDCVALREQIAETYTAQDDKPIWYQVFHDDPDMLERFKATDLEGSPTSVLQTME